MNKNIILLRDNDDYTYIYGAIIIDKNIFDVQLLQKRINKKREKVGYQEFDGNGEDIVKMILNQYKEYENVEYIPYNNYDVEV